MQHLCTHMYLRKTYWSATVYTVCCLIEPIALIGPQIGENTFV